MTGDPGAEFLALLPELILLIGAVGGLLLGLWTPQPKQWRVRALAVLACLGSAAAAAPVLPDPATAVFEGTWTVDTTTGIVRITVALTTAVAILLAAPSVAGHPRETEAYVLMLLGALGTVALAAASDLLLLMAAFLLASFPLYALAGFAKDARGAEATLKYYLMGAFSGVLMMIGIAALVLATGSTGYAALASGLPDASAPLVAIGVLGVLIGVAFKAGAVPVHFWVPDVTAGTTPAMAAFITTVPKLGAVAAAFRLLAEPFVAVPVNAPLLVAVLAAASMTLGNLAAFSQTEVLRLLAYSTVSQVGYLFMVVAVAARTDLAVPALAVYLAGYAVTNIGAFAAVAAAPTARTIADWTAAVGRRRWLVVSLVVCLLGLVGTPPTAVFVGKLAVFSAAWDGALVWLVVLAAVNTVASLFYYLRWIAPGALGASTAGGTPSLPDVGGSRTAAGTAQRTALRPAVILHSAALVSLLLGIGSGLWLAFALPA
ncbi:NADH-quinone oxidoreductase subunit N [Geodermatophilus obscurus]|uniref:NADH-quinone oxidoreductase subunit N n=1 Tax=Geodermatophilus obscurus (strain ATCC 25078 / DSM 43160 / JCM 3152 / CCUG 61914 / KCC A-0152 / KCTC 9177 / NBRC 13315 / NRRL B-3577 / G-20) TaxID=526225 RepID=D2SDG4_GEOOG|nr:proton-conducting transporter membrane subunit [Geodermatophilus obscurus]ADB74417.1 NADH/Ubiquinone/plastoquinone (complex I) [Geodermatophilus obscurus DSM 43160]